MARSFAFLCKLGVALVLLVAASAAPPQGVTTTTITLGQSAADCPSVIVVVVTPCGGAALAATSKTSATPSLHRNANDRAIYSLDVRTAAPAHIICCAARECHTSLRLDL